MPLIASFLFLVGSAALVLLEADARWIWVAVLCQGGSLLAFWTGTRALPGSLRLTAGAIVAVYGINYPLQAFFVDWLYHSESFQALWREFSLVRLDGSLHSRVDVFYLITAVLALMCTGMVTMAAAGRWPELGKQAARVSSRTGGQTLTMILAIGLFLAVAGLLIQVLYGVGTLTSEAVFTGRLDGVLYHTLVTLVPLLFMAVHWESVRRGHKGLARVSLGAYVLLALAEMSMMSSRGFIVLQMLPLLLLYLWLGHRVRDLVVLGALTVMLTVALYPVMTSVRYLRAGSGYGAADSIALAMSTAGESRNVTGDVVRMAARFIGYTSFLTSLEHPDARFDWGELSWEKVVTLRENGFTRWFTAEIAGYGRGIQRHFSSPGLLGAAQVLGGKTLVLTLPPVLALLTMFLVRLLERYSGRLGPLVPVNVLASLLFLMEEGVFDLIFTRLVLVGVALFLLSWLFQVAVPEQEAHYAH